MSRQNWTEVLQSTDVNEKAQKFHDIMVSKLDQFCPMKKRKMNKNVDTIEPWITDGLLQSRITKNKLYDKWINSRNIKDLNHYKVYLAIFNNLKKQVHKEYCQDLYEANFKDAKKLWAVTNDCHRFCRIFFVDQHFGGFLLWHFIS